MNDNECYNEYEDIEYQEHKDEMEFVVEPIIFDKENIIEIEYDEDNFQEGLDDISYVCGMITGLINTGLSPQDALGYVMNGEILMNNVEISKINKEASIKVAKEQAIMVDKNSL